MQKSTNQYAKNNSNVAHNWAHGIGKMLNGSSFFYKESNEVIYSFGEHFPIARRISNSLYYYTIETWSGSYTARHKNKVHSAIPTGATTIYMRYIPTDEKCTLDHEANIMYWLGELTTARRVYNAARAKTNHIKFIERIFEMMYEYCAQFNLSASTIAPAISELSQWFEGLNKESILASEEVKYRERIARREAKQLRIANEAIPMWRNFELRQLPYQYNNMYTILRYNKRTETVQTSKGINVPKDVAIRLYKAIMSKVNGGGCTECRLLVFGSYEVDTITDTYIVAGCHKIELTEIATCYEAMTK